MIEIDTYNFYFNNLIKGDKHECVAVFDKVLNTNVPVEIIYTQLFQRSLYQVGEYWEMNKISVATEHMATAITENLMIRLQPQLFLTQRTGKKAVIACVANEHHQVGAKMVADILEMNGWDGYFIGANTPLVDLIRFIESKNPDLIGLSLSIYYNMPQLKKTLSEIRHQFPELPVMIGGQAFRWGGTEMIREFNNVEYLSSVENIRRFINHKQHQ